jgi:hypothetical protein
VTDHCGCWRCAPKPECQKCEALVKALQEAITISMSVLNRGSQADRLDEIYSVLSTALRGTE